MSYHIEARRKMLAEGNNGPIPKMPFDKLCDLIGDAIKSVPSEKVIKTFTVGVYFSSPPLYSDSQFLLEYPKKILLPDQLSWQGQSKGGGRDCGG